MWYWIFCSVREFRKGPVFLVGDAAQSWPPFGAFGGNSSYGMLSTWAGSCL
jgi:2-polyprenyl-6-methoxyphenol hydroxylase-like FAD-dependent oxidoreductase